jgi:hypothetical protein
MSIEADYLDSKRFPLSSQPGLTLQQQRMIDAVNLDDLRRMQEEGRPMSEEQRAIYLELQAKRHLLSSITSTPPSAGSSGPAAPPPPS